MLLNSKRHIDQREARSIALLNLSSLCLVLVEWLFLVVPWGCLRFVIVVFPDHTHLLFLKVSEHDQEIPQSHTADHPMAP